MKNYLRSLLLIGTALSLTASVRAQKLGGVSASAAVIDADEITDFKEGFAIISKGTATALIDHSGKLVVPYNKYNFITQGVYPIDEPGFSGGYCAFVDEKLKKVGFLDRSMNIFIKPIYFWVSTFEQDGYAAVRDVNHQYFYINKSNIKTNISAVFKFDAPPVTTTVVPKPLTTRDLLEGKQFREKYVEGTVSGFSEGLRVGLDNKFGYYNRAGKKIIPTIYDNAMPFYEGMAAVAKTNSFGETKWGFIDKSGKVIIDFVYSNLPGNFHGGYSVVTPATNKEFEYAFIDKSGSIAFKVTDPGEVIYKDFQGEVAVIPYKGELSLLDKNMQIRPIQILSGETDKKGKPKKIGSFTYFANIMQNQMMVKVDRKFGLIDVSGNILVPPVFESLSYVDPISKLARASYKDDKGRMTNGYVDGKGIFQIVIGSKSSW